MSVGALRHGISSAKQSCMAGDSRLRVGTRGSWALDIINLNLIFFFGVRCAGGSYGRCLRLVGKFAERLCDRICFSGILLALTGARFRKARSQRTRGTVTPRYSMEGKRLLAGFYYRLFFLSVPFHSSALGR